MSLLANDSDKQLDALTQPSAKRSRAADDVTNAFLPPTNSQHRDAAPASAEDTPRYVTRQSVRDMTRQRRDTTQLELRRLASESQVHPSARVPNNPIGASSGPFYDSDETTGKFSSRADLPSYEASCTDGNRLHHMMYTYADKQQVLCNQICGLNERLQTAHDELLEFKERYRKDTNALREEADHLREISNGYDTDVQELETKVSTQERTIQTLQDQWTYANETFYTLVCSTVMGLSVLGAVAHYYFTHTWSVSDVASSYEL